MIWGDDGERGRGDEVITDWNYCVYIHMNLSVLRNGLPLDNICFPTLLDQDFWRANGEREGWQNQQVNQGESESFFGEKYAFGGRWNHQLETEGVRTL